MVKMSPDQSAQLEAFRYLAEERHTLKRYAAEAMAKVEAEIYENWNLRMSTAITQMKRDSIPNRRIGLAWGTKNQADAKKLVEKYNRETQEAPGEEIAPEEAVLTVVGTSQAPLLTLKGWARHQTTKPGAHEHVKVLPDLEEARLRPYGQDGRWTVVDNSTDELLVVHWELANAQAELQAKVQEAVAAL